MEAGWKERQAVVQHATCEEGAHGRGQPVSTAVHFFNFSIFFSHVVGLAGGALLAVDLHVRLRRPAGKDGATLQANGGQQVDVGGVGRGGVVWCCRGATSVNADRREAQAQAGQRPVHPTHPPGSTSLLQAACQGRLGHEGSTHDRSKAGQPRPPTHLAVLLSLRVGAFHLGGGV